MKTMRHGMLTIRQASLEQLLECRGDWLGWTNGSFMRHPDWLASAWSEFHRHQDGVGDNGFLGVQFVDCDSHPVGCGLWFRQFQHAIQWWRLVGSGPICSDYVQMPCRIEFEAAIGTAMANWFDECSKNRKGFPSAIEVDGHLQASPQWDAMFRYLSKRGWSVDTIDIENSWRLQLPSDWKEYEARLSKSHRRKVRRLAKLLESGSLECATYRTPGEIETHWSDFVRMHQDRRQQLNQPGCFSNPHFERFLKSAVLGMSSQGLAWLSMIRIDGHPAGALLMFDQGAISYLYQSGVSTECLPNEPGHLVNTATILECVRRDQTHLDFLRGDERYKSDWRAEPIGLQRTFLFPPGFTGRGLASALKLRRNFLHWLKARKPSQANEQEKVDDEK